MKRLTIAFCTATVFATSAFAHEGEWHFVVNESSVAYGAIKKTPWVRSTTLKPSGAQ